MNAVISSLFDFGSLTHAFIITNSANMIQIRDSLCSVDSIIDYNGIFGKSPDKLELCD